MAKFKNFVRQEEDVNKTLEKLPQSHRQLLNGFDFRFEPKNTLYGDDSHVGVIQTSPKKIIRVSAPWAYPREFTLLHEIGHLIYAAMIKGTHWESEWEKVFGEVKSELVKLDNKLSDENAEEIWCHLYAQLFCKTKLMKFSSKKGLGFVRRSCQQ